tara:strand:+ start:518 stop:802 length:285 start_codon:yes stop_codon:yes gene_type:complete
MKKTLKTPCKLSLEEEYAFEHKQRIKAESYVSELWEMNEELTNEVIKLQKIVSKGEVEVEEKPPLKPKALLEVRLKRIYEDREKAIKRMEKWLT